MPTTTGVRDGSLLIDTSDTKYPMITISLTGNGVDFSLVVTPSSGSIVAGFYENVTLTITPLGGYNSALTVSCTTNASGSVCTPADTSITATSATSMAVKITTTSAYTVIGYSGFGRGWLLLIAGVLGGGLFAARIRLKLPSVIAVIAVLVFISGATGCAGPQTNNDPTAAGTYTYTLTATDGTLTRIATYTLTVTDK